MSLLLQVADDSVSAEISLAENLLDLKQVLLLEGHLEEIVGVVDFCDFDLTLSCEGIYLVLHEE